jgi:maltose alpha-D-glucosyltransferase / alpha-amylase
LHSFDNPRVQNEILDVVRFWLEMGIDGLRCDAVPYLCTSTPISTDGHLPYHSYEIVEREGTNCENLPETHAFLKRIRKLIDDNFPGRIILAEACQLPHQVREYFADGDEFHLGFHFPIMPHIYKAIASRTWTSLKEVLDRTPSIPEDCQWVTFLRNHDERQWMWNYVRVVTDPFWNFCNRHLSAHSAKYAAEPRMRINLGIRRRLASLVRA